MNTDILLLPLGRYKSSKHKVKPTGRNRQALVKLVLIIQNSLIQENPLLPLLFSFTSYCAIRKFQTDHEGLVFVMNNQVGPMLTGQKHKQFKEEHIEY
jgi:hypothetical protein